jgi:hypothetical protein
VAIVARVGCPLQKDEGPGPPKWLAIQLAYECTQITNALRVFDQSSTHISNTISLMYDGSPPHDHATPVVGRPIGDDSEGVGGRA